MPPPKFATNGYMRSGRLGVLRCTTEVSMERTSGAKVTPTMTGEVGFSSGIPLASVSSTIVVDVGSTQLKKLRKVYEEQVPDSYVVFDGNAHNNCTGIIETLTITSKTNEVIEYSIKIAAADGKSS